jgi:hypothetical protein
MISAYLHAMRKNKHDGKVQQAADDGEAAATAAEATEIALRDKTFRVPRKKLDFQSEAIVGNIVFSTNDVTAYYEIPTTIYDFLSNDKKVSYVKRLTAAVNGLAKNQERVLDLDLKITNAPIDVDQWEQNYIEITKSNHVRSGFKKFLEDQVDLLEGGDFYEKRVYLGVSLGKRHELDTDMINPFNAGVKDAWRYATSYLDTMWQFVDKSVKESEIRIAQVKEKDYFTTIQASELHGFRATAEDIALLTKKPFYPAMPVPYVTLDGDTWGRGDMINEIGGVIETRNPSFVKISQVVNGQIMTGYRTTLTFKQFPEDTMNVPYGMPWMYASIFSSISVPFDIEARMSLVPAKKIKGDIEKGIAQSLDAYDNAVGADSDPGITLTEEVQKGRQMQAQVTKSKDPWLSGTYRIIMTAATEEDLDQYCKIITSFYDENMNNIKLVRTFHDQLDLLLESLPGDHLRENSFIQTTNLEMLSASGFNVLNQVGD